MHALRPCRREDSAFLLGMFKTRSGSSVGGWMMHLVWLGIAAIPICRLNAKIYAQAPDDRRAVVLLESISGFRPSVCTAEAMRQWFNLHPGRQEAIIGNRSRSGRVFRRHVPFGGTARPASVTMASSAMSCGWG